MKAKERNMDGRTPDNTGSSPPSRSWPALDAEARDSSGRAPHRPPIQVPDHVLLSVVGRGAYGEVWLARSALGTARAVKVVHRADFENARPFEREFRGITKYEPISRGHEGLIDILQVGHSEAANAFYYVMELADPVSSASPSPTPAEPSAPTPPGVPQPGESSAGGYVPRTLHAELRSRGRLPLAECLRLARSLASALEHLHAAGLVHRDIKPSNIVFVGGMPKLADIGLVTDAREAQSVVGTDGYLPPEGAGSAEADIYSLGKVLYEMATGLDRRRFPELPVQTDDGEDTGGFRELNEIVLRACAREPGRRYASAAELGADVERIQRGRSVRSRHAREDALRRLRQWFHPAALLVLVALLLLRFPVRQLAPPAAARPERASVFVLPFRTPDSDPKPGQSFLAPRVTDAFVDALARVEGVRPSPKRRGWLSRSEDELRRSLARTNDMNHVLSGVIREENGLMKLQLRLDDRQRLRTVWEREFVGATNDLVGLERSAFSGLAAVLGIPITEAGADQVDSLFRRNAEARRLVEAGWDLYEHNTVVHAAYTRVIALADEARGFHALGARWATRRYEDGIRLAHHILASRPDQLWAYTWLAQLQPSGSMRTDNFQSAGSTRVSAWSAATKATSCVTPEGQST